MREDQAAGLRRLFPPQGARVLLVAWDAWPQRGWLAINLAAAMSRAGEQVVMLDAERDSVAQLWGARSRYDLAHVIEGDRHLSQVLVPGPEASVIAPMRRAAAQLGRRAGAVQTSLAGALGSSISDGAVLIVPLAPASLASPLWRFGGGEQLVCAGTGSAAITAAYSAIKSSLAQQASVRLALAAEGPDADAEVCERFEHLAGVTQQFLGVSIGFGGSLPAAELSSGTPGLTLYDQCEKTAGAVEALAACASGWKLPRLDIAARRACLRHERTLSV